MACGIVPDQGWNPRLLHWQVGSLPLSHRGSPEGSLIHLPLAVCPLMRDLLWPALSSVFSGPHVQPPAALASGPRPPLDVSPLLVGEGFQKMEGAHMCNAPASQIWGGGVPASPGRQETPGSPAAIIPQRVASLCTQESTQRQRARFRYPRAGRRSHL